MSLSPSFLTPSLQLAAMQNPCAQIRLAQSDSTAHGCPDAQGGHVPPQSVPVSVPFRMPSTHVGTAQVPLVQMPLTQSEAILQAAWYDQQVPSAESQYEVLGQAEGCVQRAWHW